MSKPKTIKIDEVEYVRADEVQQVAEPLDGMPFVIIRSHGAGVFAGYLAERNDATRVVKLDGCIRLWRWTGFTLSQVATDGVAGTGKNKFGMKTNRHEIMQVLEIIPCTEKARTNIQGVTPCKV